MAFEIVIQINKSENNKIDKDLDVIASLSGTLKDSTSIINPTIVIQGNLLDYIQANYMTIPSFGRSYFISNLVSVRNNLIEITSRCDVLSSFKDSIRANKAIIRRQENLWNLYLNDGTFRIYQNPKLATIPFPNGFSTQEFVLSVAGGGSTNTLSGQPENILSEVDRNGHNEDSRVD